MVKTRKSKKSSLGQDKLCLKSAVDDDSLVRDPYTSNDYLEDIDVHEDAEETELISGIGQQSASGRGSHRHKDNDVMRISDTDTEDELPEPSKPEKKRKKKKKKGAVGADEPSVSDSDIEDNHGQGKYEDELIGGEGWGRKRKYFYGGNPDEYEGRRDPDLPDTVLDEAEIEAEESRKLQIRHIEQLDDDDFFDAFADSKDKKKPETTLVARENEVQVNIQKLSKKEQAKLFAKESPEFYGICIDFQDRLREAQEKLLPIVKAICAGQIPKGPAAEFIITKYNVILNYCTNISCYLMFKAKRTSLKLHPLTGRLVQYKELLDQMSHLDEIVMPQVDEVLQAVKSGKSMTSVVKRAQKKAQGEIFGSKTKLRILKEASVASKKPHEKKQETESFRDDHLTRDELQAVQMYETSRNRPMESSEEEKSEIDEGDAEVANEETIEDEKRRSITYEMEKNKGLIPKRSKLQRNPRVKHRVKFAKAKVRRKGQVREVRKEIKKYAGEISGINARVRKGIKLA